jgi:hypothetical protein
VRDANGQTLSYIYYECGPGGRSAAKLLSEDEAPRIAHRQAAEAAAPSVIRPLLGVKRTSVGGASVSAFDPKRTLQVALDAGYEEIKGRKKDRLLNTRQWQGLQPRSIYGRFSRSFRLV